MSVGPSWVLNLSRLSWRIWHIGVSVWETWCVGHLDCYYIWIVSWERTWLESLCPEISLFPCREPSWKEISVRRIGWRLPDRAEITIQAGIVEFLTLDCDGGDAKIISPEFYLFPCGEPSWKEIRCQLDGWWLMVAGSSTRLQLKHRWRWWGPHMMTQIYAADFWSEMTITSTDAFSSRPSHELPHLS